MQIICKKKLHFQDHEIVDNLKTGEKVAVLKRQTLVSPSAIPQEVPDWIKNDDLFNLSVDDGVITVVNVLSTPKTKGTAKSAAKATATEDIQPSGWGAKPGTGMPSGNDIGVGNK
jgi:hypothetical protein